jgi:enoyl-CoA hydratase/carnithine racemase
MNDLVLYDVLDGNVAQLTFNRPDRLNAYDTRMGNAYLDALERATKDPEVRSIVVTGAGRAFCAGADTSVLGGLGDGSIDVGTERTRLPQTTPLRVPKPIVAAINGPCVGYGFVQACFCDIRFAAAGAKIGTAFARRGLIAEYGTSWILPRLIGHGNAADLLLSGRTILAEEARDLGFVQRVFSPGLLMEGALTYARELATASSPTSMAIIKRQMLNDWVRGIQDAAVEADSLMAASFRSPDFVEGVSSFLEKRTPDFPPLRFDWDF